MHADVDFFLQPFALAQQAQSAHHADAVCSQPADREYTQSSRGENSLQRAVFELTDDARVKRPGF
nr:hypothetical protein H9T68_13955 [Delftia sp. PS-11]